MQDKPYYCPNCRANRTKFSVISSTSQRIFKDAITGTITEMDEAMPIEMSEPDIQCMVCSFVGNEMRFIKAAEREPRTAAQTGPTYT